MVHLRACSRELSKGSPPSAGFMSEISEPVGVPFQTFTVVRLLYLQHVRIAALWCIHRSQLAPYELGALALEDMIRINQDDRLLQRARHREHPVHRRFADSDASALPTY